MAVGVYWYSTEIVSLYNQGRTVLPAERSFEYQPPAQRHEAPCRSTQIVVWDEYDAYDWRHISAADILSVYVKFYSAGMALVDKPVFAGRG